MPTGGGGSRPADAGWATGSCSSGHPQPAAVSTVDSAVRTPGRGSAALPDTGHCRSRPHAAAGHGRRSCSAQAAGVAMPGGRRSCSPGLEVVATCGSRGLEHRVRPRAAPVAMSTVATARVHHVSAPAAGIRVVGRTLGLGRQAAAARAWPPTSAWPLLPDTVLSGHRPSGRRSFRKQRRNGQSVDRSGSLQLPLRFLKAGLRAAACGGRPRPPNRALRRPTGLGQPCHRPGRSESASAWSDRGPGADHRRLRGPRRSACGAMTGPPGAGG
jgi:hypothetical protein